MTLLVLGLNYQSAPLALREPLAFTKEELVCMMPQIIAETSAQEIIVLSTCNRTEIYCTNIQSEALINWLCRYRKIVPQALQDIWYVYHDAAALRHLARVAAGLDSMVLGEPQILGQVKEAYQVAQQINCIGSELNKIFQQCFYWAKKIRSETDIGKNAISLAFAAVNLAKHIFANFAECRVTMVGAGETIALAARHFAEQGVKNFRFANRTLANAEVLAQQFNGAAFTLSELPVALDNVDIIVAATESSRPLITDDLMRHLLISRSDRPVLLLDLAVPRNIESTIADLPDCYLYTIDDLQALIKENIEQRQAAAILADEILEVEINHFLQEQKTDILGGKIQVFMEQNQIVWQEFNQQIEALSLSPQAINLIEKFAKKLQHQALQFLKDNL